MRYGRADELRSLTKRHEYFADTRQLIYEERRKVCRKPYKVDAAVAFLRYIEKAVLEDTISPALPVITAVSSLDLANARRDRMCFENIE